MVGAPDRTSGRSGSVLVFHPQELTLGPGERRRVEVALRLAPGVIDGPVRLEANLEITQLLDGQMLGG